MSLSSYCASTTGTSAWSASDVVSGGAPLASAAWVVVVVSPAAVVAVVSPVEVVAVPAAVVDVSAGAVVVVDASVPLGLGIEASTGRKRSSAVVPTRSSARCWSFTPGRETTIVLPWRAMSGSATPSASTRLRMIPIAWSSLSLSVSAWA